MQVRRPSAATKRPTTRFVAGLRPSLTGIGMPFAEKRRRFLESKRFFRSDELWAVSRLNIATAGSHVTRPDIASFRVRVSKLTRYETQGPPGYSDRHYGDKSISSS
jgi:hypothetical protein